MICPIHKDEDLVCAVAVELERKILTNKLEKARECLKMIQSDYYNDISSSEVYRIHSSMAKEALNDINEEKKTD